MAQIMPLPFLEAYQDLAEAEFPDLPLSPRKDQLKGEAIIFFYPYGSSPNVYLDHLLDGAVRLYSTLWTFDLIRRAWPEIKAAKYKMETCHGAPGLLRPVAPIRVNGAFANEAPRVRAALTEVRALWSFNRTALGHLPTAPG